MAKGPACLELHELIAAIIGRGTVGYDALKIGACVGDILKKQTYKTTVRDLTAIPGMGSAKACQIVAALELARRFSPPKQQMPTITGPADVLPFVSTYRYDSQENVVVLTLTGAHEVITTRLITRGILDNCQIHPREVFAGAIEDRAGAIILVHNHPSGCLTPSVQDIAVTQNIKQAGELLGIRLLDHLIVGPTDGYRCVEDGTE